MGAMHDQPYDQYSEKSSVNLFGLCLSKVEIEFSHGNSKLGLQENAVKG